VKTDAAIARSTHLLFSSGMSAITTMLFALLNTGDHLIITDDAYKRSRSSSNRTRKSSACTIRDSQAIRITRSGKPRCADSAAA
jgi:cystathionine beta-lyase/cystathionine gamma-synthase